MRIVSTKLEGASSKINQLQEINVLQNLALMLCLYRQRIWFPIHFVWL